MLSAKDPAVYSPDIGRNLRSGASSAARSVALAFSCWVVLLAAGCGDVDQAAEEPVEPTGSSTTRLEETPAPPRDESSDGRPADEPVDCSAEGLDDSGEFDFVAAYLVEEGRLGQLCFGSEDDTLVEAWQILADIVPPAQLRDLALFGGFEASGSEEEPTLAFVNSREDTDGFQMSVNLTEAEVAPEEFPLTMMHEFAHVFTGVPTELDRTVAPEDCSTWHNGDGCYVPGSLLDNWTAEFWADELGSLDPFAEPSADEGQARCAGDPGFFGAYAASHPEEDFAEAFAAWVFEVPAENPAQRARYEFMADRPGLLEFRQRAAEGGYGPLAGEFDECGLAA